MLSMIDKQQIYDQWLKETEAKLIAEYERLNFRASGRYANALEPFTAISTFQDKIGVLGAKHAEFMARGRGATREGLRGRLYGIILQWVKDKGIRPRDPKMTERTLAWLIARKIDLKGYSVDNRKGVIYNVITDEWIAELFRRIGNQQLSVVRRDLTELIKKAAA
jgi:hypothetical protein